jgi:hypothetical protein
VQQLSHNPAGRKLCAVKTMDVHIGGLGNCGQGVNKVGEFARIQSEFICVGLDRNILLNRHTLNIRVQMTDLMLDRLMGQDPLDAAT